jgi:hypothetical protein
MSSVDTAVFFYPRWYRRLTFASIPLVALIALAIVGAAIFGTMRMPGTYDRVCSGAVGVIGLWMLLSMWLRVRYAYVLSRRYVIGDEGILIEAQGQSRTALWPNIRRAEYFPLFFLVRLVPDDGGPPVVLFLDRRYVTDSASDSRNKRAMNLIKGHLLDRFQKSWTPVVY